MSARAEGAPAGGEGRPWSRLKCLVVIPTYNESACIAELIRAILAQPIDIEILVVDDRSPDGTADLVRELAARDGRIHLLERAGKMGLGSAYVTGFRYALEKTAVELVFQMDADFSHDPAALPGFLAALDRES